MQSLFWKKKDFNSATIATSESSLFQKIYLCLISVWIWILRMKLVPAVLKNLKRECLFIQTSSTRRMSKVFFYYSLKSEWTDYKKLKRQAQFCHSTKKELKCHVKFETFPKHDKIHHCLRFLSYFVWWVQPDSYKSFDLLRELVLSVFISSQQV